MSKIEIKNLTLDELFKMVQEMGEDSYRAEQIFEWIYQRDLVTFDRMTNISKTFRDKLAERFTIANLKPDKISSQDGSVKLLFNSFDRNAFESVVIPMQDKFTQCLSSQIGCPLGCKFCLTGKMGFKRNLEPWEIVEQVSYVRRELADDSVLSNLVFMGMGEPLLNYENLYKAIRIIKTEQGLNVKRRKITVSTAGVTPLLRKVAKECDVQLAVSLNASNDKQRSNLMPFNKKHELSELVRNLRNYPLRQRDKITFEYVLLADVNDRLSDARALKSLLRHIKCKINLIPFNEVEGLPFKRPTDKKVERFREELKALGFQATIRKSKGADIGAACGQLVAKYKAFK